MASGEAWPAGWTPLYYPAGGYNWTWTPGAAPAPVTYTWNWPQPPLSGWMCPGCGQGYSPAVTACGHCVPEAPATEEESGEESRAEE